MKTKLVLLLLLWTTTIGFVLLSHRYLSNQPVIKPHSSIFNLTAGPYPSSMVIVKNVCVLPNGTSSAIFVFASNRSETVSTIKSGRRRSSHAWPVHYVRDTVPYRFEDGPVFFTKLTCEGNLFHFFHDSVYCK